MSVVLVIIRAMAAAFQMDPAAAVAPYAVVRLTDQTIT